MKENTKESVITAIAIQCHSVIKAYCESLGDYSQPTWVEAPEWQKASVIKGVQFVLDNENVTPEDTHNSWMLEKQEDGWVYGEVKDPEKKTHPGMLPYNKLPQEQRSKDYIFKAVVGLSAPMYYWMLANGAFPEEM